MRPKTDSSDVTLGVPWLRYWRLVAYHDGFADSINLPGAGWNAIPGATHNYNLTVHENSLVRVRFQAQMTRVNVASWEDMNAGIYRAGARVGQLGNGAYHTAWGAGMHRAASATPVYIGAQNAADGAVNYAMWYFSSAVDKWWLSGGSWSIEVCKV